MIYVFIYLKVGVGWEVCFVVCPKNNEYLKLENGEA